MDDSFDLQQYLNIFARHWRLIAGLAAGAAIVALVVSSLMPPTYEATALVIATKPLYQLQFDPRIENVSSSDQNSANKALPQLATADTVVQQLYNRFLDQLHKSDMTLVDFKDNLSARAGADPSVIQLTVREESPQLASLIANDWATNFVSYTNELYQQREAGVAFFEAQANDAKLVLTNAEQALVAYQSQYQGSIINTQLQADSAELSAALRTRTSLRTLMANASLLQDRLAGQLDTAPANLADDLSSLLLQISSLDVSQSVPIQIQFADSTVSSGKTVSEQKAFLAGLLASLQTRAGQVDEQINTLQPQILSLQQKLQAANTDLDRLTRDRDLARDTYLTLTKKVNETQISAQDTSGQMRVASLATMPTKPVGPRKAVNTVLGGIVGLMIGLALAYVSHLRTVPSTAEKRSAAPASS
jgi:succinoglycan biosynthesis transport protein ExoP